MSRPADDTINRAAQASDPVPSDLQAALASAACLGAWSHDGPNDRVRLSASLAGLLGIAPGGMEVRLAQVLCGIHGEDRLRIESMFYAASETGGPLEAEFRTLSARAGTRWLRLMGRCERSATTGAARMHGLAFDLTEARRAAGTPAQQAHRQVNQLADHVIAIQGLVASLSNPPLSKLVEAVAVEVGFELARRLHASELGPQH